ncbi:helix-turn-helix domain-containing protein, partial [Mesorhizobium sp. M1C.F.Ca.ET.188.01.1.1]|uniref:helix-turn-helix domain-containing protein n=1 Tax=Mesorhizobium sp. M1C.F.Ca.ET.188.01.1.1 TaxID=2563924 RepID=UPI0024797621
IEDIQRIVARHYNVSKTELLSNRRTRTIVRPRQVAMYLSKVMTPRSLPEIGRRNADRYGQAAVRIGSRPRAMPGAERALAGADFQSGRIERGR